MGKLWWIKFLMSLAPAGFVPWLAIEALPELRYIGYLALLMGVLFGWWYAKEGMLTLRQLIRKPENRVISTPVIGLAITALGVYVFLWSQRHILSWGQRVLAYVSFSYLALLAGFLVAYLVFRYWPVARG